VQLFGGAVHVVVLIAVEQRHSVVGVKGVGSAWNAQDVLGIVETVRFESTPKQIADATAQIEHMER